MTTNFRLTAEQMARIAHAAHREYCAQATDEVVAPWDEISGEARASAIDGVIQYIAGNIRSERGSHDAWMYRKLIQGWRYGANKNEEEKTHPCLVPYEKLPLEHKVKDSVFLHLITILDTANDAAAELRKEEGEK